MNDLRRKVNWLRDRYRHVQQRLEEERSELVKTEQQVKDALAAQELLQSIAAEVQASAHQQIASVVTRCLRAVFGDNAYEFKIDFEKKRGRTEARLLLVRDGLEIDALDAAGGGIVDVTSFALRLVVLILLRPAPRRLLVLDEPLKHLSREYIPRARELIESLTEELDFQVILVTHNPRLACGKVIQIGEI